MKTMIALVFAMLAISMFAADQKQPETPQLPFQITLKNGAVLKKISVVRWDKEYVVLKHQGGIDPVRYTGMDDKDREIFEIYKAVGLVKDKARKDQINAQAQAESDAYVADMARKEKIRSAISTKHIVVGMTPSEAIESWGPPDKINSSGGSSGSYQQWIYGKYGTYVYFRDGKLSSWQDL